MPDLVIFDCDGVLVDTERTSHDVIAAYLAEFGFRLTAAECHRRFIGCNVPDLRISLEAEGAVLPADFVDEVRRRILATLAEHTPAVPGIHDALAAIDRPICVASSGRHVKIRQSLRLTGLLDRFEGRIFSAEDVARAKPAPDLFLHAANAMGADPARCLVIEDSPPGIQGAAAAGMTVIAYADPTLEHDDDPRTHGAHHVIDRMHDLPSLIKELETAP